MKSLHQIISVFCSVLFLSSCLDKYSETYTAYVPVYMSYSDLRSAVKPSSPRPIEKPGKIYFKDNILFVVERLKGIHMVDVSNPAFARCVSLYCPTNRKNFAHRQCR